MSFTLEYDAAKVSTLMDQAPGRTTRVIVRALNRGIGAGRTLMVKLMAADMNLPSTVIRNALRMREATAERPTAELGAGFKRIPLIQFGAKGPEPSRGRGRGVTYKLSKGRGRHPNAFIATMGSGHRGVFVRVAKGRLPIRELFGPSHGWVFEKHRPEVIARTQEAFEKTLGHEVARAIEGADAG